MTAEGSATTVTTPPERVVRNADDLLEAAREAANKAHCPYSNFHVGAAVRCADGTIVSGCNVENASFGLTICAEQVALFSCVAQGLKPLELAVSCVDAQQKASIASRMPCGSCRQVMKELLSADSRVHIDGVGTKQLVELLPDAFSLDTSEKCQLDSSNQ